MITHRRLHLARGFLLVCLVAAAVGLGARLWPGTRALLTARHLVDCGDAAEAGRYCHLVGAVGPAKVLVTAEGGEQRLVSRLETPASAPAVFLLVPAERPDVAAWRARHGDLTRFPVSEVGLLADPEADRRFADAAQVLRSRFELGAAAPVRIFDTTDQPADRWPGALAFLVVLLIAGRALLGLVGLVRQALVPPPPEDHPT